MPAMARAPATVTTFFTSLHVVIGEIEHKFMVVFVQISELLSS